jgi:four helix bundle protein
MENNVPEQNSTNHSRQRHYPPRNVQRSWREERRFPAENQQQDHAVPTTKTGSVPGQRDQQKTFKSFRDLAIWQRGISLVKTVYQATGAFPKDELYGLVSQMRRASASIPSNIAEGYRRKHAKEFQQFLNVALGSIGELETQVILAGELNYLSAEGKNRLLEELDHLVRMTISLCNKVQR